MAEQTDAPTHGDLLPRSELAWLVQHHKLRPDPERSPLADAGAPEADRKALKRRGVLSDEWTQVLRALAEPDRQIRVVIPGTERSLVMFFYAVGPTAAGLIGCWDEGDGVRISFPWTPEGIATVGSLTVAATPSPAPAPFTTYLSPGGLALLSAAVDVVRESLLRSLLDRTSDVPTSFDAASLLRQLQLGLSRHDPQWMVSLMNILRPVSVPLGIDALAESIEELSAAGLVELEGARATASPILVGLAQQWRSTLPAAAFEYARTDGTSLEDYRYRIAIRGDGPLCVMDFSGVLQGRPIIQLRFVGAGEYFEGLTALLSDDSPAGSAGGDEAAAVQASLFQVAGPVDLVGEGGAVVGRIEPGRWYPLETRAPGWVRTTDAEGRTGWVPETAVGTTSGGAGAEG